MCWCVCVREIAQMTAIPTKMNIWPSMCFRDAMHTQRIIHVYGVDIYICLICWLYALMKTILCTHTHTRVIIAYGWYHTSVLCFHTAYSVRWIRISWMSLELVPFFSFCLTPSVHRSLSPVRRRLCISSICLFVFSLGVCLLSLPHFI